MGASGSNTSTPMKSILKKPEEEIKVEEVPEEVKNATDPTKNSNEALEKLNKWDTAINSRVTSSTQTTIVKVMTCTKKTQTMGNWGAEMLELDVKLDTQKRKKKALRKQLLSM